MGTGRMAMSALALVVIASVTFLVMSHPNPAYAEPKYTTVSLRDRIEDERVGCEAVEPPGKLSVSVGTLSVTTTCRGGASDGRTCTHTFSTFDCSQGLTQKPESIAPGAGDTADPGQNPQNQTPVLDKNAAPTDSVAEDPTRGEEVTATTRATTDEVVLACESLGGIATVDSRGGIGATNVHCRGGVLDGTTCIVGHYDTYCPFFLIGTELDAMTPETMPDLLVDPDRDGNVVVMSQHVDIDDAADAAGTLCEGFGGTSSEHHEWEIGFEHIVATSCEGGLLDGMTCTHYYNQSVCIFRAIEPDSIQIDPPAGNEVPAESAPAAPSPTVMPTEIVVANPTPTTEPTVIPTIEPTAVPTEPVDPPTFPTPPTDDVVAPPGEAQDPVVEPTPTVVVLT